MSILIKGMEMPKGCITCMFKSESLFNRTMWCEWLDDPLGDYTKCDEEWRHPDCPLVEVPTPHGRLIDCETLKDDMAVLLERNEKLIDDWLAYTLDDVIDTASTITEAEEGEEA